MNDRLAAWRQQHQGAMASSEPLPRRKIFLGAAALACVATGGKGAAAAPLAHAGPRFGPVPERNGAVPWRVLAGVTQMPDGTVAEVAPEIMALDGTTVVLDGYMVPYDDAARQRRFLITPYLVDCPYCAPGGATGLVEVFAARPVAVTQRAFSVRGRFAVVPTFETGFLYKLTGAVA